MVKLIMFILLSILTTAGYVYLSPIAFRFALMGVIAIACVVYPIYYYWTDSELDPLAQEVERERTKINQ